MSCEERGEKGEIPGRVVSHCGLSRNSDDGDVLHQGAVRYAHPRRRSALEGPSSAHKMRSATALGAFVPANPSPELERSGRRPRTPCGAGEGMPAGVVVDRRSLFTIFFDFFRPLRAASAASLARAAAGVAMAPRVSERARNIISGTQPPGCAHDHKVMREVSPPPPLVVRYFCVLVQYPVPGTLQLTRSSRVES